MTRAAQAQSAEVTYRADVDMTPVIVHVPGAADQVQKGSSGVLAPGPNETRSTCPKCGSPYLVTFAPSAPRFGAELPDFTCVAGDCGYTGPAKRRV